MATVGRINGASFNNTPRLSYISTAAFNTYFYSYSTSINMDLETVGTLGPVAGATSGNCPKGRVLRENGRKLYPAANPGITTYLVGVYDAQTMLNGFIDPNAKVFQIYNTDKPTYLEDGVEPSGATTDLGPSVYTRGDILAEGNMDISGNAVIYGDLTVKQDVDITGTTTMRNHVNIATGDFTVSTGKVKLNNSNGGPGNYIAGNAIVGRGQFNNANSVEITTTACDLNSYIFLTLTQAGGSGNLSAVAGVGSFLVRNDAGNTFDTFNWFIINPK